MWITGEVSEECDQRVRLGMGIWESLTGGSGLGSHLRVGLGVREFAHEERGLGTHLGAGLNLKTHLRGGFGD